jgi:anaerobic magnesium-protoporphyrin IX monomethyl ester cyclase
VDGICIGEGEGAILDLANELAAASPGGSSRLDIPNWWFKVDGSVVKNAPRPLIADLSALPQPDRELIYAASPVLERSRIKHFLGSRGCPYDCSYCFNHAYYAVYRGARRHYRHGVDNVIAAVNAVRARWPLEQIVFVDDLFILHEAWLRELAEKWPQQVGLPFFCNVRADLVTRHPARVELLRRAGCSTVSMGIETANEALRVHVLKRKMSNEEIVEAGRIVRAAGISLTATNILALPGSRLEDDFATMRLNPQAGVAYAHGWLFQP